MNGSWKTSGCAPGLVTFLAIDSEGNPAPVDQQVSILCSTLENPITYTWYFGDGATGTGNQVSHAYTWSQTPTVMLISQGEFVPACTTYLTVNIDDSVPSMPTGLTSNYTSTLWNQYTSPVVTFQWNSSFDPCGFACGIAGYYFALNTIASYTPGPTDNFTNGWNGLSASCILNNNRNNYFHVAAVNNVGTMSAVASSGLMAMSAANTPPASSDPTAPAINVILPGYYGMGWFSGPACAIPGWTMSFAVCDSSLQNNSYVYDSCILTTMGNTYSVTKWMNGLLMPNQSLGGNWGLFEWVSVSTTIGPGNQNALCKYFYHDANNNEYCSSMNTSFPVVNASLPSLTTICLSCGNILQVQPIVTPPNATSVIGFTSSNPTVASINNYDPVGNILTIEANSPGAVVITPVISGTNYEFNNGSQILSVVTSDAQYISGFSYINPGNITMNGAPLVNTTTYVIKNSYPSLYGWMTVNNVQVGAASDNLYMVSVSCSTITTTQEIPISVSMTGSGTVDFTTPGFYPISVTWYDNNGSSTTENFWICVWWVNLTLNTGTMMSTDQLAFWKAQDQVYGTSSTPTIRTLGRVTADFTNHILGYFGKVEIDGQIVPSGTGRNLSGFVFYSNTSSHAWFYDNLGFSYSTSTIGPDGPNPGAFQTVPINDYIFMIDGPGMQVIDTFGDPVGTYSAESDRANFWTYVGQNGTLCSDTLYWHQETTITGPPPYQGGSPMDVGIGYVTDPFQQ